jgi:toxin-antitoxin system PIN domain toxin
VTYQLDVNLLVVLLDAAHSHHEPAHRWFSSVGNASWATCPLTENGLIRVLSNPAYPNVSASPLDVANVLRTFCSHPEHVFWPDTISLPDSAVSDLSQLQGHQQITDLYLAALAKSRGGKLATFDTSIPFHALVGGSSRDIEILAMV